MRNSPDGGATATILDAVLEVPFVDEVVVLELPTICSFGPGACKHCVSERTIGCKMRNSLDGGPTTTIRCALVLLRGASSSSGD